MITRAALIVLAVALVACGEAKLNPSAEPVAGTPGVGTPGVGSPVVGTPVAAIAAKPRPSAKERALAKFDAEAAKGQATTFRAQLAAGRKAVKEKQYAAGITALAAALAVDPTHAAALAELGWAYYLNGELGPAERFTTRAIAAATLERTRGAALYNLGRIHEDRGEKDEAALAYERSLALRPNETVAGRLAALRSAGAVAEAHECDPTLHSGRPPFDLCAALVAKLPASEEYSENHCLEGESTLTEVAVDAGGERYGGETATIIALKVSEGLEATSFGVERWMEAGGAITERHLAVLFDERWYTLALGSEYNPGVGYIGENFIVDSITAEDLVPGGRPELLVKMTFQRSDGDYGDNALESSSRSIVGVLSLEGEAPRWLGSFTSSMVEETGPMLDDEPSEAPQSRRERKVEARFIPEAGALELSAVPGFEPSTPPGRFVLGTLPAACPGALSYVGGG